MSGKKIYYPLVLLLMILFSTIPACAQYFELENSNQVKIPFRMIRNMVIIKLTINDRGPFNFILDSGVGIMIITEPNLIDSLNITYKRTLHLAGVGVGEDYEAYVTAPLKIEIPGIRSVGVGAAIFKKDHFGLSNYIGIPIHGLLGYEFFNKLVVKLNFTDSILTAYKPDKFKLKKLKKFEAIPILIENNKPYITTAVRFCDGSVRKCKLIVDIGAGHPLSLDNHRVNQWPTEKTIEANLGMGLTGPISGEISRVNQLSIGKYGLNNVLSSFPETQDTGYYTTRDGNLGMDVLKRFTVVFDYENSLMYVKACGNLKEPFEHDMSGMEYYAGGDGLKHIVISRVEPGSASDEIGLAKNDEIMSVNLKPVANMSLEDLDHLFKSGDGRGLLLEVYHDKQYSRVILTLKRRI
jgi:hypothetical protein